MRRDARGGYAPGGGRSARSGSCPPWSGGRGCGGRGRGSRPWLDHIALERLSVRLSRSGLPVGGRHHVGSGGGRRDPSIPPEGSAPAACGRSWGPRARRRRLEDRTPGAQDGGATAVSRRQRVLARGVEALRVAALGPGAALLLRGRSHRLPLLRRAQEPVPGRLVAAVPEEVAVAREQALAGGRRLRFVRPALVVAG